MFAFSTDETHIIAYIFCGLAAMFVLFVAYAVCIYATNHTLKAIKREHDISEATYKMHRTLIRSLMVQMMVPFGSVTVSLSGILLSIVMGLAWTEGKFSIPIRRAIAASLLLKG